MGARRKPIAFEEEMRRNTAEDEIEEHATTSKEGTQAGSD